MQKIHYLCNQLFTKTTIGIYGKSEGDSSAEEYEGYAKQIIKVGKGMVIVELFNEDEMDGASNFYTVSVLFQDWVD